MNPGRPPPIRPVRRRYRWWLAFPFVWQAGLAPLVNDVAFRPFGLPFPMAWQMVGVAVTSGLIAWVFRRDAAVDAGQAASTDPAETTAGEAR